MQIINKKVQLEGYEVELLERNSAYIDVQTLELIPLYKVREQEKIFCLDVLSEMIEKNGIILIEDTNNLIEYVKENFSFYKNFYHLSVDIRDYPDLLSWITFKQWEKYPGHELIMDIDGTFFLIEMEEK